MITRLNHRAEDFNVENADLRKRLSKYEDPQSPKNYCNSSVPPTNERMGDEIKMCSSSLSEKSWIKPGGQLGHEGSEEKLVDCIGINITSVVRFHNKTRTCRFCNHVEYAENNPKSVIREVICLIFNGGH